MNSLLGSLCIALTIALVMVLWTSTSSEFWHVNITDVLLAAATVALVGSTIALWLSAERSTQMTERADVKMSHTPPGAAFGKARLSVEVQIKNAGRTPGSVTDLVLTYDVLALNEELPLVPNYGLSEPEPKEAFLAASDKIFVSREFDMDAGDLDDVMRGLRRLYVYGYVDYTDVFAKRHRAGYARVYERSRDTGPPAKRNNLLIVANRAYNYDKPMPSWS